MAYEKNRTKKKDNIVLNVKHSTDKEVYKNNIISGLYLNGIILRKLNGIFTRHKIPYEAQLDEDLNQIIFEELCKKSSDEIIEMYEDDPSRLVGLCVRIAIWKGVAAKPTENPKTNFTKSVLFMSRLGHNNSQEAEDIALESLMDETTDLTESDENLLELNELLDKNLTAESKQALEEYHRQELKRDPKKPISISTHIRKKTTDKIKFGNLLIETNFIINHKIKNIKMEKSVLLNEIEKVLPQIREYHRTRKVSHLTTEDLMEIKRIWDTYINPAGKLAGGCSSCYKDAMDIMESFYSANKPKEVQAELQTEKLTFDGVVEVKTEEPKSELEAVKAVAKKAIKKPARKITTKK